MLDGRTITVHRCDVASMHAYVYRRRIYVIGRKNKVQKIASGQTLGLV